MKQRRRQRLDPNTVVLLKQIGIGVLVLICVGLLVTAVWYGTRLSALTITEVVASGGETIAATEVAAEVEEQLTGTYLGIIPRRFAWLYPKDDIEAALASYERMHNIDIGLANGHALEVTYDERVPHALWCTTVESDTCVFVDRTGHAFGTAPLLSGGSFLRFTTLGRDMEVGTQLLPTADFTRLLSVTELLASQGWYVSHVEVDQASDAFLQIVDGGELKISITDEPATVVENLLIVLSADEFEHVAPGNFHYIDLRFGNKVFVNEQLVTPTTTPAVASTSSSTTEPSE